MRQEALVGGAALGQRYGCEDRSVEGAAHAQAHGPEELRILIESSREHGTLEAPEHELLTAMLAVQNATVSQVMTPAGRIATVPAESSSREVELASRDAGRSRLAVIRPDGGIGGIVHVRDAFRATTFDRSATAADLMADPFTLPDTTPVTGAIRLMREHRCQLALVADSAQTTVGIVALEDLLEEVIGEFDDETDPVIVAAERSGRTTRPGTSSPEPGQ